MTRVAVVGYASRDHAMTVEEFLGTAGTTLVRRRLSCPWPGNGGVAYVLRAIAANGLAAQAVSWVGDDEDGAAWTADLRAAGVDVTGVSVVGERTPAAWLLYTSGGKTACIYDPGDCRPNGLTAVQRGIVHDADWCVVMAGPRAATRTVLAAHPPGSGLAWAVKNDPDAFPPDLVSALLARARVVTYGGDEHDFLAAAIAPRRVEDLVAAGCLLVETRGSRGVRWRSGARGGEVAVRRIDPRTPLGRETRFSALSSRLSRMTSSRPPRSSVGSPPRLACSPTEPQDVATDPSRDRGSAGTGLRRPGLPGRCLPLAD